MGEHAPDNPRDLSAERLLASCRWEAFRGPGPGGQKRNKTSSAVRVTHEPTGLSATADESRSQAANRAAALGRLRLRLALELRSPVPERADFLPAWFGRMLGAGGRLRLSRRDERYCSSVGIVLDVLAETDGSVSAAARRLGLSTANLVDFLQREPELLTRVNALRESRGLKRLGGH